MGCAQSKIDNEESVSRCKERRNLIKEAVSLRNAFASAHSGYSASLKDTGAALNDYAEGEVHHPPPEAAAAAPELPPLETPQPPPPPPPMESSLPPPPPPLPNFSPITPLQRAVTMPAEFSKSETMKGKMKGIAISESDIDEEEEEEEGEIIHRKKKEVNNVGPKTPVKTPDQNTPSETRGVAWDYFFMDNVAPLPLDEVEEEDGYNGNLDLDFDNVGKNMEFKTPEKQVGFEGIEEFKTPVSTATTEKQFLHSNTAPPAMDRVVKVGGKVEGSNNGVDLLKVLSEMDDCFLKASQSSQGVSKMLEATRLHYHSNFADTSGHIDHAARVMQVITWNKSLRGVPNNVDGKKNNLDSQDYETHATVLDKLLAWEKKLYEEVKASELIKLEYRRKVAVLNKLKKRNASSEQLEKEKAAVSHLHTQYIVDMQSLDSTVSEVNDIRDMELYPKLVALVNGMTEMWDSMCTHHESQLKIVTALKSLSVSGPIIETTKHHHERTKQISVVVEKWHSHFEKLVTNQRQYIHALNSWLKLNLIPIESSLKEKVASPQRNPSPPIQSLLRSWNELLDKLPDEVAKSAIASFDAVIKTIIIHQEEEMKSKEKYEETRKEYLRKKHAFEEWYKKHSDKVVEANNTKDPLSEKQFVVDSLKKRLDEEMEEHQKHCIQVREKSLGNLKIRLPELFRALSDYAHACFQAYKTLRLIAQSQHVN